MLSSNTRSPLESLVDDVLQQIFLWSIIDSKEDIGRLYTYQCSIRKLPQLSISHVCSTWRRVALLTPRLWNRVYIKNIFHRRTHRMVEEWLSRARNTPVSIKVDALDESDDSNELLLFAIDSCRSSLLSLLSPYRIQHLDVKSGLWIPFIPNLPPRNLVDLETFNVECAVFDKKVFNLNISQYPKLSRLSVRGNCRLSGTCNSLLELDIPSCFLNVHEVGDILVSCPSLQEFSVSVGHDFSRRLPTARHLHLPHLRILRFVSWGESTGIPFASMIDPLTLPCLEMFHIYGSPVDWSTPAFGALVQRSNGLPHLTSFCLNKSNVMVDAGAIIALIPSVNTLSICASTTSRCKAIFDSDTLNRLEIGSLGPQLKEIRVGRISNPHEFMHMVEFRMETGAKCHGAVTSFTRVQLNIRGCDTDVSSHLTRLEQLGIPISQGIY